MKVLATVVCLVTLCAAAYPECVTVQEPAPPRSSRRPTILVELGGVPLAAIKIVIYPGHAKKVMFEGATDKRGALTSRKLPLGDYFAVAHLSQAVIASTEFRVVRHGPKTAIPISVELPWKTSENLPIRNYLKVLRGSVGDPSGAPIPSAIVVVVRIEKKDVVLMSTADTDGHFSSELPDGSYLAFVLASGFRTSVVPFEIEKGGSGELDVTLLIGGC